MVAQDGDDAVASSGQDKRPRSPVQQRLHDGYQMDRRYLAQMMSDAQTGRSARVNAVLELKQNLDASFAKVGAQNSAVQAREQARRERQAREYQTHLDKNAYEVARRNMVAREARKERLIIEQHIQEREAKLLKRLEGEKVEQRKREKAEVKKRAYEKHFQREMGRAAHEKSSEHRRNEVSKHLVKSNHGGMELSSMLLPRRRKNIFQEGSKGVQDVYQAEVEDNNDAGSKTSERTVMPILPGTRPGQDLRHVNHALLPSSDVKLPPIRGLESLCVQDPRIEDGENQITEATSESTKHKKPRGRSVLEERQLAIARQMQKDSRFAQPQVVCGKTFTGNAFLASPQMLWFKDFDVGRPLALTFTLTNVSNTFNQFRLLPMDDKVVELFDIVYERPGRMSAGMSCSLKMTFTGMEECDLNTTLSVAAPTGVFQLPVCCTCKKAVPILDQREVRFPEIVVGEQATVALTLANDGALPLEYFVRSLPSSSSQVVLPLPAQSTSTEPEHDDGGKETEEEATVQNGRHVDTAIRNADVAEEQRSTSMSESPHDDNEVRPVGKDGGKDKDTDVPALGRSHAASCAVSSKTLATCTKEPKAMTADADEDDGIQDHLNPEETGLIERVCEGTAFRPEGADEPVRFVRRGVVAPYSSSSVSFSFAPATAMKLENEPFVLEFPALSSLSSDVVTSIPIFVSGVASQVPISVARSRLHFRCCAYGKLYRHQLIVSNRGKVALKVQVQVPKPLAGFVDFDPSVAFVQAATASQEGKVIIQVRFRPEERMWTQIERARMGSRHLGMLAVPIQVVVPDQVVPVFFVLSARPTSAMLKFYTGSCDGRLQFGTCCIGHSVSEDITITNSACVSQRIGVTSLPKDVSVSDISEGVGIVLLPGEARTLQFVYIPSFPGALKAAGTGRTKPLLTLWSSTFNQEYTLPCSGNGVASDIVFTHSVIRLGATSLGQRRTCDVSVTNQSYLHTRLIELRLPPEATPFLRITPLVSCLAPRQSMRLEIDFEPTEDIFKLAKRSFSEAKTSGESQPYNNENDSDPPPALARRVQADVSTEATPECASSRPDESCESKAAAPMSVSAVVPRSCQHTWSILCFQQQEGVAGTDCVVKTDAKLPLQALEIRTTAVDPVLIPSTTLLDFGQVAIGQNTLRDLTVETASSATDNVLLHAQPLHIFGAFRLIGALREMPVTSGSRRKRAILVEFKPNSPLLYEDELELSALGVNIRVRLRGQGINPSLSLAPADGSLDFHDVLARTHNTRNLVLTNGSAFPLAFSIVALDDNDAGIQGEAGAMASRVNEKGVMTTLTGLPVFTFSPSSAIIPENASLTVRVVFQPDRQRPDHYSQRYRIKVPNKSEQHVINVFGRCWENQLYVFAPDADSSIPLCQPNERVGAEPARQLLLTPCPVEDVFDLPPSVSLSQLSSSIGLNDLSVAGLRKPTASFVFTFAGYPSTNGNGTNTSGARRITKTLYIGSTTPRNEIFCGLDEFSVPVAAGGSAGSFELMMDDSSPHATHFTLQPARGVVAPGQHLAIQVTYSPPARTAVYGCGLDTVASSALRRLELEAVQRVQVRVQCILKGGSLWHALPTIEGTQTSAAVGGGGQQKDAGSVVDGIATRVVTVILQAWLET